MSFTTIFEKQKKMDKKSIIGLLVIGVILFGFTWYNVRQETKQQEEKARQDSIALVQARELYSQMDRESAVDQELLTLKQDTINQTLWAEEVAADELEIQAQDHAVALSANEALALHIGSNLFEAISGEEQIYMVESDLMKVSISNKGGQIVGVELKNHKKYGSEDLVQIYAPESAKFDLSFFIDRNQRNVEVNSSEFFFRSEQPEMITFSEDDAVKKVAMRLYVAKGRYLEYIYTIKKSDYMIDFNINFVNMDGIFSNQSDMQISWDAVGPQSEKGFKNENTHSTIAYKYPGESSIEDLGMSTTTKTKDESGRVQWIAFKRQFYSAIFVSQDNFSNASMRYDTYVPRDDEVRTDDDNIKKFHASVSVPFIKGVTSYDFNFYFGPNHYSTLKQYGELEFQRLVPLGWGIIGWANQFIVIPVFNFLGGFNLSYGIIILLLTIFVKLLIFPLTYKSYLSMAKMRLLKPEIDQITQKYPNKEDAMKKQQATMALYKSAGVNPMGGCIPLLIQFPILIALFRFFPASIELRGQSFLWADDLSSYDEIINLPFNIPLYGSHISLFPILMAGAMFVTSKMSYQQQVAAPQMAGMKFMMLYMMPVMMLLWFNNYASGLTYYYFLSTLMTILINYGFRYVVSDEKIHARMKETAKKPKKQSKWQQRYAEMQKAQQHQQEAQKRKANKSKR